MGSAGFEALLRRLALLVLQGLATVLARKVELVDFLDLDGDAEAVEVVPARAPTLVFVGALHPAGVGDVLAADAFVLVFVFDFVDGLEGTVEGLVVVLVVLCLCCTAIRRFFPCWLPCVLRCARGRW